MPLLEPATEEGKDHRRLRRQASGTVMMNATEPDRTEVALLDLLVGLLEFHDPYYRGGSALTRLVATEIGRALEMDDEATAGLAKAAVLRDMGRIAVDNDLVPPRVELDAPDRERIHNHVQITLQLLEGIGLHAAVLAAIRHHHECWDGRGYPDGLCGEEIPLAARVLAVADSFVAMIGPRPYRLPRRLSDALDELMRYAGTRYDPRVVDALVRALPRLHALPRDFGLRRHMVVVHPDDARAVVLAARLCARGYLADTAPDLAVARERTRRVPLHAVVLDGRLTGAEAFVRELRDRERGVGRGLPVVAVDIGAKAQRLSLLEAGADLCLPTDADPRELLASIESLFRRSAPADDRGTTGLGGPYLGASDGWRAHREDMPEIPLSGVLGHFPLSWLLQVLQYDARTGAVVVDTCDGDGIVYVERGEVAHACTREDAGEAALRRMLGWRDGRFTVHPERSAPEHTINRSTMHLLLDQAVDEDHADAVFGTVRTG